MIQTSSICQERGWTVELQTHNPLMVMIVMVMMIVDGDDIVVMMSDGDE